MDIRSEILKEHSTVQLLKIAGYIGEDEEKFGELIRLFLEDSYRVSQRSSRIVNYCTGKKPRLVYPYLRALIENLKNPVHNAVKRNTVRLLQYVEIPDDLRGLVANTCFGMLENASESIAVRVFSMSVLGSICKKEPELGRELRLLIEEQLPFASAGFRSRAKKVLKELDKNG